MKTQTKITISDESAGPKGTFVVSSREQSEAAVASSANDDAAVRLDRIKAAMNRRERERRRIARH